jgi:sulfite exporter TauE/SafE
MIEVGYLGAFIVGLLGGVHCVGMCGGIVGALTFGLPPEKRDSFTTILPYQLAYNLGRLISYGIAGAIMGGLGMMLGQLIPLYQLQQILYGFAGIFMILLGLYLGGWWSGLIRIEKLGGPVWRTIEPFAKRLLPIRHPGQALILGLAWGWVPCGLVYSVLIWSVSSGGVLEGAGLMLAFGLGTLPNLLAMGFAATALSRWSRDIRVRRLAGVMVILFGCYALWQLLLS